MRVGLRIWGIEWVSDKLPHVPAAIVPDVLRLCGAQVGEGSMFKSGMRIDNATGGQDVVGDYSNLTIGNRCYIGKDVFFDLPARINIEDEAVLSVGVRILTHADCGRRAMSRWYPRRTGDVFIGRGTWLGAGAIVLAGVSLGSCCVVGAGSVVTRSVPDFTVVAGVPAERLRELDSEGAGHSWGAMPDEERDG